MRPIGERLRNHSYQSEDVLRNEYFEIIFFISKEFNNCPSASYFLILRVPVPGMLEIRNSASIREQHQ